MKATSLYAAVGALLLYVSMSAGVRADDTEIFFNQSASNVGANVLLILDTSGSMDDEVTSTPPYDPTVTYPTSGSCSSDYYYYASSGTPTFIPTAIAR